MGAGGRGSILEAHGSAVLREATVRAILAGVGFGVIFGAANAYLGLRVGLTVSTSIPIAVISAALFRMLGSSRGTILEANLAQTIGSASSSLASGTIFTIPALFIWGLAPPYLQVTALAFLGGILGISAMVPLRRLLIVDSHAELPYPEGTACAAVLRSTEGASSGGRWIVIGLVTGAAVKIALGGFALVPDDVGVELPLPPLARLDLEVGPALLAVGYILGYRGGAVMVSGSLLAALVITPLIHQFGSGLAAPLAPESTLPIGEMSAGQIWSRYVRTIGAGAVAAAGIFTVGKMLPTMAKSFLAVARGMRGGAAAAAGAPGATSDEARRDRDVPPVVVVAGIAVVVLSLVFVPGIFGGSLGLGGRAVAALAVTVFGILFVGVSSRIVGLIGVSSNPTSGMALVTILGTSAVFVALGWTSEPYRATVITVAAVVCVAASKAGDISQDLKTGYLVGGTPYRQQFGQLLGASVACWAVAGTVLVLGNEWGFGSKELPAPQATLMKTIVEGVLAGTLSWGFVTTGAALALIAILAGLPGLSFAIGLYLPLGSMAPIFLGGLARRVADARRGGPAPEGGDPGILCASGLIAGEGLAGVAIAGYLALTGGRADRPPLIDGGAGEIVALLVAGLGIWLLYRSGTSAKAAA